MSEWWKVRRDNFNDLVYKVKSDRRESWRSLTEGASTIHVSLPFTESLSQLSHYF